MKKWTVMLLGMCLSLSVVLNVSAEEGELKDANPQRLENLTGMDEEGNTYEVDGDAHPVEENDGISTYSNDISLVNFNTKGIYETTSYTVDGTGKSGYTNGGYGADGVYLGESNGKVKFMLSGVVGWVNRSEVNVVSWSTAKVRNGYYVSNGRLIHGICHDITTPGYYATVDNGPAPAYLSEGVTYYSYDGHYFYTENNLSSMVEDYNAGNRNHALNAGNEYRNYFQFADIKSNSNYSAEELNSMISSKTNSGSKMWNVGQYIINSQSQYGINALFTLSVAGHESAWGTSSIAQQKNNLFGLNAVDSTPGLSANGYPSVESCIQDFTKNWMANQYCNPGNGVCNGAFLGNKAEGCNVNYASDPYWGEEIAAYMWKLDRTYGNKDTEEQSGISYATHVSNIGWQSAVMNGNIAGTIGQGKAIEALTASIKGIDDLGVKYTAQVSNIGWQNYVADGETAGTTGQGRQTEAIKMELTGGQSANYDIYYSVHVQNLGWLDWAKNGNPAGSEGFAYRAEAIRIVIVKKGASAPGKTAKPYARNITNVEYSTHVENVGWQDAVENGTIQGTEGRGLRMEAIKIALTNQKYSGGITYKSHVENDGWQDWVSDGALSGTSGRGLRVEALQIKLTGDIANEYDVYYCTHIQNFGWSGWAKNGESCGSEGYAYRLEAIKIMLVKKGDEAPGTTDNPFYEKSTTVDYNVHLENIGWQGIVQDGAVAGTEGRGLRMEAFKVNLGTQKYSGNIEYKAHVENVGWQNFVKNGALSGTSGRGLRMEAVQIKLTGEMAENYDIYYCVHAQNLGWMGWAKNGESAGTAGYGYRLEALKVMLVKKGGTAPGSTANAFSQK